MKRGKAPPIDLKLTRSERLHRMVFKDRGPLPVNAAARSWIERNCFQCEHRNVERMVTATLLNQEYYWKHICTHRGPTKLLPLEDRKQGGVNCSGFSPSETSQNNSLKNY